MVAPDNALRGIIYNAVDSKTQDQIVQDLQSMNVNIAYAIADARQMGRSQSILITFVGTTTRPSAIGAHVTGSRPCKLRFDRNGPSSPPATSKPQPPPPAPPTGPIHKTSRPSRRRSASCGARSDSRHRSLSFPPLPRSEASTAPTTTSPVSWKSQPHTSDPQTAALKATIAAQQLQIQELSSQLQAALARLSSPAPSPPPCPATAPSQTPPQPAPAEEPMNTAPSAASSRASSPSRHPPHKRRSPSSDDVAPERDSVCKTDCFLEAFEQRVMARFVRLECASVDNRVATIESHLTALNTRVAVLEARQSATEATLAHLAPRPLTPAPTPTTSAPHATTQTAVYCTFGRPITLSTAGDRLRNTIAACASVWSGSRQTCDRMAGNLGLRDTWSLLRVLLDPTHTKASQRKGISHLLHSSPLTDTDFLAALRDRYLCTNPPTTLPAYTGSPNPDLEADISTGEVRAALLTLRTTSAPGADRITNKALRNLDTPSLEALAGCPVPSMSPQQRRIQAERCRHFSGGVRACSRPLVRTNFVATVSLGPCDCSYNVSEARNSGASTCCGNSQSASTIPHKMRSWLRQCPCMDTGPWIRQVAIVALLGCCQAARDSGSGSMLRVF
ncbi:hypothetical protein HPB49_003717 [Dermacentor silvarum]|uniref:Uncharacterized protein n=1 Tax=Dermacentor silvarum TaxID=543639 RepID=A0ACB8DU49_DERSI|nr:hypothetical protein HPB49_003717 [Dermacentor silvarum]